MTMDFCAAIPLPAAIRGLRALVAAKFLSPLWKKLSAVETSRHFGILKTEGRATQFHAAR